ncbi:MAG: FtsX-like permease family protein [Candidatus Gracilibacteria bacterium]
MKPGKSSLTLISIAIAIAALTIFTGLNEGIKTASFSELEKENPLDQITVRAKSRTPGVISLLAKTDNKLDQKAVDEISKINGIENVYKEIQFNNFATIEINLLGFGMMTDTLLFGVPEDFIKDDLKGPGNPGTNWNTDTEPYPVIIPRQLLDMYNSLIATPQGLPTEDEKSLLGKEILLYPNYSTFFPGSKNADKTMKLKVVGFSSKVNLIGATLPYSFIEQLNEEYGGGTAGLGGQTDSTFLELFVETAAPEQTPEIAKQIEALGYTTDYYQKNLKDVTAKLTYLSVSLGMISLIIIILAALTIISNFLASIIERRREIGLFRALGATKFHIKKIILLEAGLIGFIGSTIGLVSGLTSTLFLNKTLTTKLSTLNFTTDSVFHLSYQSATFILIFGTLLSIVAAYIPAAKAAKMNPFQALK